jgi:hypothetical protein
VGAHYPVLTYPGNITGSDMVQPGALLGHDEIDRPYEVIDAEYIPGDDKTLVYLQYATTETLRVAQEASR